MEPLNSQTLGRLPSVIQRPAYDRSRLATGIGHLGLGAFHRAHLAVMTEAAVHAGDLRWGIAGVHLRGRRGPDVVTKQDGLYSVIESHGGFAATRVVGVLRVALYVCDELEDVLGATANPQVAIVTSTVTEKGYSRNPATADLSMDDAEIQHEFAHPQTLRTTLGVLAAGLSRFVDVPTTSRFENIQCQFKSLLAPPAGIEPTSSA